MDGTEAPPLGGDNNPGWIAVDLDGTLAHYDHWRGPEHIGHPVPRMVEFVKGLLASGREVRIFTARASGGTPYVIPIQAWSQEHLGQILPVTCLKDFAMDVLFDDRARQVGYCTGHLIQHECITQTPEGRCTVCGQL